MKVQSRLGVTIPQQNDNCCCVPEMYKPTESTLDHTVNLVPYSCTDYTIEWQEWSFIGEAWEEAVGQLGTETYEWVGFGDVALLRVKMSKEGCCDVYSTSIFFQE